MGQQITFWYGIPQKFICKERIIEAIDAGFNVIECRYDKETNFKVLKWCEELGIKAFVYDSRVEDALANKEGWQQKLDSMVADYAEFSALECWFLRDEPNDAMFPDLGRVTEYMKAVDPEHPIYINLLPLPAVLPHENYQRHIDNYLDTVKPALLSYDHYNLMKTEVEKLSDKPEATVSKECRERNHWENKIFEAGDREGFYDNLEMIKKSADKRNIPWMNIILLVEHWNYRKPTEGELRWEAFTSFAYGSQMVSYFTYWTPSVENTEPWSYHHGIIEADGSRDPNYEIVKGINKDLQALYKETNGRYPKAVLHTSEKQDIMTVSFTERKYVKELLCDSILYSEYDDNMFMLVNKEHSKQQTVKIRLQNGKLLQVFDKKTGNWNDILLESGYYVYIFSCGEGELFRII